MRSPPLKVAGSDPRGIGGPDLSAGRPFNPNEKTAGSPPNRPFVPCTSSELHHGVHQRDGRCQGCMLDRGEEPLCLYCAQPLSPLYPCRHTIWWTNR